MDARMRGKDAEDKACQYLQSRGLRLLRRNFRSKRGEIDLILQDKENLVFVEVRYRHRLYFGSGAESVDWRKQTKLIACAQYFLQQYPDAARQPCRFDVIAINGSSTDIEWIQNAFTASE